MASLCSLEVSETVQQIRFWVVFVQTSLSQGVYIAGYSWNGDPLCVQSDAAPSGWKPIRGRPFLLRAVLQPKQALVPRLRLAENKNASSEAHSDLSDSRLDAASFCN